jgi:APA family basic amino acid/polyamine antiporter
MTNYKIKNIILGLSMSSSKNIKLNLGQAISLVLGNMIGVGIFMLPSSLSQYGSISIIGWVISGLIALFIASIFRRLSSKFPGENGAFYYTEKSFGEFIGFFIIWGYWVSILLVNASIAIAVTSYSTVFFNFLNITNFAMTFTILILLAIAFINYFGVKTAGNFQLITSIIKIIPLLVTIMIGFYVFEINNFFPIKSSTESNFNVINITTTLTFFAFLGIESATIPADKIENPKKNIPRATMIGTVLSILIYLLSMIALIGIIPTDQIANSNAPFADAIGTVLGDNIKKAIAIFAIISGLGSLNGWTLLQIEIPKSLAKRKLMGKIFQKKNKNNVPYIGLIISTLIVTSLIIMNFSKSLTDIFTYLILTSTFCSLMLYLFISISEIMILVKQKKPLSDLKSSLFTGIPSFIFIVWLIYGVGYESIISGLFLLSFSIPIYIYQKKYA